METEGGVGSEQFEVLEVKEKFGGLRFYARCSALQSEAQRKAS
jgi:hypothetical protein